MPVTYIPPVGGGGGGGLMNAFNLWNKFAGPESKQNAANLALTQAQIDASKQGLTNAAQEHDIREEVRGPNLATANATAARLQTELGKVTNDEATRSGSVEALNNAPLNLWKPTDQFTPDEFQNWKDLHAKYGARDLNGAATAWNKSMANIRSQHPQPAGAIPSQYTTQNGETAVSGYVLPNLSAIPGLPTPQPAAQSAPSAAHAATPAPAVAPPAGSAPSSAPAPASSSSTLPDIDPRLLAVPAFRQMYEAQLATKEKQQQIEKNQRELAIGSPEQQKQQQDFSRNAALLTHRLSEMQRVVNKVGNYPYSVAHPEESAQLDQLPMMIADNWNALAGQQGVIRPATVEIAKHDLLPVPSHWWTEPFTPNSKTVAAINNARNVVADYVKANENAPSTRIKVDGLTPLTRIAVGPTAQVPDPRAQIAKDFSIKDPRMLFLSPDEVQKANLPKGTTYYLVNPMNDTIDEMKKGNESALPQVNGAPPLSMGNGAGPAAPGVSNSVVQLPRVTPASIGSNNVPSLGGLLRELSKQQPFPGPRSPF